MSKKTIERLLTVILVLFLALVFCMAVAVSLSGNLSALEEEEVPSLEDIISDNISNTDFENLITETDLISESDTSFFLESSEGEGEIGQDEIAIIEPQEILSSVSSFPTEVKYTGFGEKNNYVYSVLGTNDYNYYLSYKDSQGNEKKILSYCYNKSLAGPESGAAFNLTYPNATNAQFYGSSSATWWKNYFKAVATRIIYYGYPYNMSGNDYLKAVVTDYGVSEDLAEDAFRWATQNALWYWTGGEPELKNYQGVKSGENAMLGLAFEIYTKAYNEGYTVPNGLEMDIFTPDKSSVQNMLAVHNDYQEPIVPSVEKISVNARKIWEDEGLENDRPDSVKLKLYKRYYDNLTETNVDTNLSAVVYGTGTEKVWTYTFEGVPKYYDGKLISYFVKEDGVDEYYTVYESGTDIYNTHIPVPEHTSVSIKAKKILNGSIPENMVFTFEISKDGTVIAESENDKDGNILFELTYDKAEYGKTYSYLVSEKNEGVKGVTYDGAVFPVTVTVSNGGKPTATYEEIKFNNTYVEPAEISVTAKKTLDGIAPGNKQFEFVLSDKDGNEIERTVNDADGNIVFSPIEYDKAGSYEYHISEVDDRRLGIIFDKKTITAVVEVTMNTLGGELDGKTVFGDHQPAVQYQDYFYMEDEDTDERYVVYCLDASKAAPDGKNYKAYEDVSDETIASAMSKNTYSSKEAADRIRRILYYFDLYPDDYPSPYTRQLIIWQAAGFNYLESDAVNSILQRVKEVPDTFHTVFFDNGMGGYQSLIYGYSEKKTAVRYVLEGEAEAPVFENITSKYAKADIVLKKTLDGKLPGEHRFTFVLKDSEGKELQRKQNDENGNIVFDEIILQSTGEYVYTVSEINDGQEGITYDTKNHSIYVTVKENGEDALLAEISGETDFKNTTAIPSGYRIPDTGGAGTGFTEIMGLVIFTAAFLIMAVFKIKKEN